MKGDGTPAARSLKRSDDSMGRAPLESIEGETSFVIRQAALAGAA
jgi:hypothetical protein